MPALTAKARNRDSLRPLVGDGAVEIYVAGKIAANAARHPAASKWMQPPQEEAEEDWDQLEEAMRATQSRKGPPGDTREEWDMLWEFNGAPEPQTPPADVLMEDEGENGSHGRRRCRTGASGPAPHWKQRNQWKKNSKLGEPEMDSPDRELLRAVETAERGNDGARAVANERAPDPDPGQGPHAQDVGAKVDEPLQEILPEDKAISRVSPMNSGGSSSRA
ncbi:hypothetical protein CYMTET_11860 [Cymbomonas tetramitiformis]|uniref:Uncharacterized protein n=1 Tax=Cymbomonas tetramitiformis TaxID=36881 RepID=A0AAE0LCR1_9CHLO|nr:hypothetical protein CYMTET_11860 [Cymbomonas tetramitiformis]